MLEISIGSVKCIKLTSNSVFHATPLVIFTKYIMHFSNSSWAPSILDTLVDFFFN